MEKNKTLRIFGIILEASFIGSILLYIYNYFVASKKYDIIPASIKGRLNIFIIIAIISFIAFLVVKYILYLRTKVGEDVQLQMDFDDDKQKDLEAPVTERVFIYKNEYEVPKERQMVCKNCGSIIDKNAFICVKCGYLLKKIVQEKVVERVIEKPTQVVYRNTNVIKPVNKAKLINILINLGLMIGIIIVLIMIINLAIQRGIIM